MVRGLCLNELPMPSTCNSCEFAKITQKPIKRKCDKPRVNVFGAEIHSDMWEPSPVQAKTGKEYYVSFTDNYTRFTLLYLLCKKSEVFDCYKQFCTWAWTQKGVKIKILCSD